MKLLFFVVGETCFFLFVEVDTLYLIKAERRGVKALNSCRLFY
jgi:hypothetical protein